MKMSNKNKFISGLVGVAMCPMMLPTAAFAADDGAASEVSSSPTELIQLSDQSEGADTGASSVDAPASQSKSAGEAANAIAKAVNEGQLLQLKLAGKALRQRLRKSVVRAIPACRRPSMKPWAAKPSRC